MLVRQVCIIVRALLCVSVGVHPVCAQLFVIVSYVSVSLLLSSLPCESPVQHLVPLLLAYLEFIYTLSTCTVCLRVCVRVSCSVVYFRPVVERSLNVGC